MPSPFPGMDPYLESPDIFPDLHANLITGIQTALNRAFRPRYVARIELRVYMTGGDDQEGDVRIPDVRVERGPTRKNGRASQQVGVLQIAEPLIMPMPLEEEVEERYLAIRRVDTAGLVAVLEVLSPTNKVRNSPGRTSFLEKRREVLGSEVHWIEIDLLRAGMRAPPSPPLRQSDYRVVVSRADERRRPRYWPIGVQQRLPVIGIPLAGNDADAPLDLGAVLTTAYDNAAYDVTLDYTRPPVPPLRGADARWANRLLRERGLR